MTSPLIYIYEHFTEQLSTRLEFYNFLNENKRPIWEPLEKSKWAKPLIYMGY